MRRPPRSARGYTLVALTIGIAVMLILITAILPLASAQEQREREEELIFRGRQYAEGIRCFQRKYGRFPNSLKEMYETRPRTIRKLWKDPITNSNDWGIITLGTTMPLPGQGGPGGGAGSTSGGGSFGGFGTKPTATPTPAPTPTPSIFGDSGGGKGGGGKGGGTGGSGSGGGDTPLMPVMGVYSKSQKKAYRIYQGRDVYAEWRFTKETLNQVGDGNDNLPPGSGPGGPGIGGGGGGGKP